MINFNCTAFDDVKRNLAGTSERAQLGINFVASMAENALLVGLVRTLCAVSAQDWADGDWECIQGHLEQAIGVGGLSEEAKTVARDISAALDTCLQQCSGHRRLAYPAILGDINRQCNEQFLGVAAQSPSVS